jgi:hypothetical protein
MSLPQDILAALNRAGSALSNVEIREALGLPLDAANCTKVASALAWLRESGAVEPIVEPGKRMTYLSIPGWKPKPRSGGVPSTKGETRKARKEKAEASTRKAATRRRGPTTRKASVAGKDHLALTVSIAEAPPRIDDTGHRVPALQDGMTTFPGKDPEEMATLPRAMLLKVCSLALTARDLSPTDCIAVSQCVVAAA